MAVKTRSKLGGQKEQERDRGNQIENPTAQKESLRAKEIEKKCGTEPYGVEIKKEILDEVLDKNSTDLQPVKRGGEDESMVEVTDVTDVLGRSKAKVDQGRSAGFSYGRADRKMDRYSSTSTGKRRLFANKTVQRNKKFFQDIRQYAQTTLTDEFIDILQESTGHNEYDEHNESGSTNASRHRSYEDTDHTVNDVAAGSVKTKDFQHRHRDHATSGEEKEVIDIDMEIEVTSKLKATNKVGNETTNMTQESRKINVDKTLTDKSRKSDDRAESVKTAPRQNRTRTHDHFCNDEEFLDLEMDIVPISNPIETNKAGKKATRKETQELGNTVANKCSSDRLFSDDSSDEYVKTIEAHDMNRKKDSSSNEEDSSELDIDIELILPPTELNNHGTNKKKRITQAMSQTKRGNRQSDRSELSEDSGELSCHSINTTQTEESDTIDYNAMLSSYDIPDNTPLQEGVDAYENRIAQSTIPKSTVHMEWSSEESISKEVTTYVSNLNSASATKNGEKTYTRIRNSGDEIYEKNQRVIPVRASGDTGRGVTYQNYERRLVPRNQLATETTVTSMNERQATEVSRHVRPNFIPNSSGGVKQGDTGKKNVLFNPAAQSQDRPVQRMLPPKDPASSRGVTRTPPFIRRYERIPAQNSNAKAQFKIIAKSVSTVDQTIRERGLDMVEDKTLWVTPVKIEFNIERHVLQFNVREQVTKVLEKMKVVDSSLKIKSSADETVEWTSVLDLPEDVDFSTHFKVQEFSFRKMRKVVIYMTLVTRLHINRIKYGEHVKEYLFSNNIWFKPDRFETKVESSPGVITMIHPKLTNRDEYKEELQQLLQVALPDFISNDAVQGSDANDTEIFKGQRKEIPIFFLETSVKKWRDLSVEVIRINCAKEDSDFLKLLLSFLSEQNGFKRGVFVPEGLHLLEGKELVYNILQSHDVFVQSITSIPLSGILYKDLSVVLPSTKKTLRDTILSLEGVESLEKSRDRFQSGNFSVLAIRTKISIVTEHLERNISDFYKGQSGQTRMVLIGQTRMKTANNNGNSVMSYAEALSTKFQPSRTNPGKQSYTGTDSHKSRTKDSTVQRNTQLIDQRPAQDSAALTSVLPGKQISEESMQKDILSKLKEMELKQTALQKKHDQLQEEQIKHHNEQQTGPNQTKNGLNENTIEEIINRKLVDINTEQDIRIRKMETKIKQEVVEAIDKKADSISVTVGNHVTAQLMGLFQQYLIPKETKATNVLRAKPPTPLITQEGQVTPSKAGNYLTDDYSNKYLHLEGTDTTNMLEAINEIDTTTTKTCSPHDTFKEQLEDPC